MFMLLLMCEERHHCLDEQRVTIDIPVGDMKMDHGTSFIMMSIPRDLSLSK